MSTKAQVREPYAKYEGSHAGNEGKCGGIVEKVE